MTSGMIFEQRQIFKAKIVFSNLKESKVRPVLIISHNKHNKSNDDLICCPITSNISGFGRTIYPADYETEKNTLQVPQSQIKSQHPFFIHKSVLKPLENGRVKIKKELARKIVEDINEIINTK